MAFLAYAGTSFVLYAAPIATKLTSRYVDTGTGDSRLYLWSLEWWPHALSHGADPLFTRLVWAPKGVSLAWVTSQPAPSTVMWPITRALGSLFSYNVLLILAPALAGWGAYLLCRRLTRAFWPSLAGGYLFGFSTYMVAEMHGHLNLVLVFPLPLLAYLVVRRLEGSLGPVAFVAWMTAALVGLFLISTELFATMALFGGIALAGGFALGPSALRGPLLRTAGLIAVSGAAAALLLSPYLVVALANAPTTLIRDHDRASVDLLGFVVPRTGTLIGGHAFANVTERFTALMEEDGAYLGIPLVLALVAFLVSGRRSRASWLLGGFIAVAALLALGPVLHVDGRPSVSLPGSLLERVPLLKQATPDRLTVYLWIGVAVAIAVWLSAPGRRGMAVAKWGLVALGAVLLLPAVHSPPFHPYRYLPSFFADGTYRRYLHPGEIVLLVTPNRSELYWQAESDFSFRLAAGSIGVTPQQYTQDAITAGLRRYRPIPGRRPLAAFLTSHRVGALVVAEPVPAGWARLFDVAGGTPHDVGGVTLVRVVPRNP
jgi:hypothetical protein